MTVRPRTKARVAATIAVLSLGLAACTGGGADDTEDEPLPVITGNPPVTIDAFAPQGPEVDLTTNGATLMMKEMFDITFNWETTTYDSGPAMEKRQISLASGDYPDLYLLVPWVDQFSQSDVLRLGEQGVLVPLNQHIEQYGPNIKKALDGNPAFKAMATAPDGKIYGLPQWNDCYHCSYPAKLWMNTTWLEELNLPQPKTTEDMRTVLRAFKNGDPNRNGQPDEIPLSADVKNILLPYFMNAFIYYPMGIAGGNDISLVLDNGKVDLPANKDGWREGLRYLKSLYAEGLIDKGALTQNADALQQQGENATAVILGSATVLHPGIFARTGLADGRDRSYDPVPPLTGPGGTSFTAYNFPSAPGATFALTNKSTPEEQIQAIKMLDSIFTTDGQVKAFWGPEGTRWEKPEPGDVALNESVPPLYKQIPHVPGTTPPNAGWEPLAQYHNTREFRDAEAVSTDLYSAEGYERRLNEATKLYEGHEDQAQIFPSWEVWVDPDLSNELGTLQTNVESYVLQNAFQFVSGARDIDTEWDAYVEGLEALGLRRYLEIYQGAYDSTPK